MAPRDAISTEDQKEMVERAISRRWEGAQSQVKKFDGEEFISWKTSVEDVFATRLGGILLQRSLSGDAELQGIARAVLRGTIATRLHYLLGDQSRPVHELWKSICSWHSTQCRGRRSHIEKQLYSESQALQQTGEAWVQRKLKQRHKLEEAEGEMSEEKLCDLIVTGLKSSIYGYLKQQHRAQPYTEVESLHLEITRVEEEHGTQEILDASAAEGRSVNHVTGGRQRGSTQPGSRGRQHGGGRQSRGSSRGSSRGRNRGSSPPEEAQRMVTNDDGTRIRLPRGWFGGHCDVCGYRGHQKKDCPDRPQLKQSVRAPKWAKRTDYGASAHQEQVAHHGHATVYMASFDYVNDPTPGEMYCMEYQQGVDVIFE